MSISNLGLSSSDDGNAERTIKKGQKRARYLPENSEGWSAKSRYKLEYWRLVNRASFLLFASRMQPNFSVSVPFCSTRNLFMGLSGLAKTSDVFWRNNNKRPVASSSVWWKFPPHPRIHANYSSKSRPCFSHTRQSLLCLADLNIITTSDGMVPDYRAAGWLFTAYWSTEKWRREKKINKNKTQQTAHFHVSRGGNFNAL